MAYTPTAWVNGTTPALNATNLNKIEGGIEDAHDDIATLNAALVNDLIAGVTPTLADWTVDPTDAAHITDGVISTFCTTGNKIAGGGWQYAYFEWDLGEFYDVLVGGVGVAAASAGTAQIVLKFWDGSAWVAGAAVAVGATMRPIAVHQVNCSKVRLSIASDAAATITPNIRGFHVWRL